MDKKAVSAANAKRPYVRKTAQGAQPPVSDVKKPAEIKAEVAPEPAPFVDDFTDGRKFLSESDVLKIQLNHLKLKMISTAKDNADLRMKLEDKDMQILQMRMKEEVERIKANVQTYRRQLEQNVSEEQVQKDANREELRMIGEKHGVSGKPFGYNPDTLELITD